MRFGCLASLALWVVVAVLLIRPGLFAIFAVLAGMILMSAIIRDPDWPLY